MKNYKHKTGVTLVEILVVVAVIAILVTMVIGIAFHIDTQGKEQLTENTIALLTAALGKFGDYGYSYKHSDYAGLKFPLDCNNFSQGELEGTLKDALGAANVSIPSEANDPNYSGSEALYFFLSRVPDCRETLDKIDKSLITSKGSNGGDMTVTIDGKLYPLFRVIDPWGETLRYDYYDEDETDIDKRNKDKRNFPLITSAGPDKKFGTADDIKSRD